MKKIFAILILTFAFTTGMLLTAAPVAQAGLLVSLAKHAAEGAAKHAAEGAAKDAAKLAKGAEATANVVKIENKGAEATGVSVEANAVKFENKVGGVGVGGGGDGGGGGGGDVPVWFYGVLCVVGVGGLLLFKFRGKRA
jgi:hypothetical protein